MRRSCFFVVAVWVSVVQGATVRPVDTGEALVNPGMGWTMHFYSNIPTNYGSKLAPSDTLDDFPRIFQLHLEMHDFVDVLKLAVISESLSLQEHLNFLLIFVSVFVVHLYQTISTFSFFLKNSKIYEKVLALGMNVRHS